MNAQREFLPDLQILTGNRDTGQVIQVHLPDVIFTIPCVPTAQARPCFTRQGHAHKSDRQEANERTLEALLAPFVPVSPLSGALELRFTAYFPVPRSLSLKKREAMLVGKIGHTVKPDLDNLEKQLKDALTRMRFWQDDKLVCRTISEKKYAENPRWEVAITRIAEGR